MASTNKQRVTLVTPIERQAAVTGGVVDDRVPEDTIRQRLADEAGIVFKVDQIIVELGRSAGRVRGFSVPGMGMMPPVRMERAEIVQQSQETIRTIDALIDRLANLHPDLDCWANDALVKSCGEFIETVMHRCQDDLYRLRAAIDHAGKVVERYPAKKGPKPGPWSDAVKGMTDVLQAHSTPRLAAKSAKGLAVDLLSLCGLQNPRKGRGS